MEKNREPRARVNFSLGDGLALKKIFRMVRLTVCCFFFSLMQILAVESYSQQTKLSLNLNNQRLEEVLKTIEDESEFFFFYNRDYIDVDQKVNIAVTNQPISVVLSELLKGTDIQYKVIDRQIILSNLDGLTTQASHQQSLKVSGKVTDSSGQPLPGVTIAIKGTTKGTISDAEGSYSISNVPSNGILVFSFVGMKAQEIPVMGKTSINVVMTEETVGIQEVVAVGYGTQKRKDVTGSISSVSQETLESRAISTIQQGLQGLAPGINISQRNAAPGELSAISIRGVGSLTTGYEPLWVIDGIPTDQRNAASINPADVESIDILKDASSTAIYGSRGANGVIIITTKKPKLGKALVNVNISSGVSYVPESFRMEVLNAEEYVQYMTESYANRGVTLPAEIADWDGVTDTDWQDLIYKVTAFQNYSISVSGGNEKVSYLMSGNYIDQGGVTIGEGYNKYSSRIKLEYRPTEKITIGLNMAPNYSTEEYRGREWDRTPYYPHVLAAFMSPTTPVRNPDGSYAIGVANLTNPLEAAEAYNETRQRFRMLTDGHVSVELFDGLTFKTSIATSIAFDKYETYQRPTGINRSRNDLISLQISENRSIGWLSETTVDYKKVIGKHSFNVLTGYTAQSDKIDGVSASVSSFDIIGPKTLNFGNSGTLTASSARSASSLISYIGRLNYSYNDKYLLTATIRRDGSSRFGVNKRFANFGSAAIGWRISEESFLKDISFLDDAKLRASIGKTGSNSIPDFVAKSSLTSANHAFGINQTIGVINSDSGNINLTWETSDQIDLGLDLTMFNSSINVSVDYYDNTTSGLLLNKPIVLSSGFPNGFLTNIGKMRNSGIEASLGIKIINKKDIAWSAGANVTRNYNEVINVGGGTQIQKFYGVLRHIPGMEYKQIFGVEAIGIAREGDGSGVPPGDIIFKDVNNDGTIGNFVTVDGIPLGSPNQDWTYGISSNFRYKNFTLSALLQGQAGAVMMDFNLIQQGNGVRETRNISKEFHFDGRYIDEAHPGDGKTPRAGGIVTSAGGVGSVCSLGIQSTDYLRIKNLSLAYDVKPSLLKKYGLNSVRIFTSVENLFTFTKFIGGNPDAITRSAGPTGPSRLPGVYDDREIGLNLVPSQPLPRIVTLGLNITF